MKSDTRLCSMLHLLLHMAEAGRPLTSEALAGYLGTNAVVVRRTMAGLRRAGIVASEKGHGGGWRLDRLAAAITLADVHEALGSPELLAFGNRSEAPQCLAEQAVNARLAETMAAAQALVLQRLAGVTLADIATDFDALWRQRGHTAHRDHAHA